MRVKKPRVWKLSGQPRRVQSRWWQNSCSSVLSSALGLETCSRIAVRIQTRIRCVEGV
jgi:hypothetical protein